VRIEEKFHELRNLPVFLITGWGDDVSHDLLRAGHRSKPTFLLRICRRRHDLGDRIAKLGYADWLPGAADMLKDSQTSGLELGDGDFLHREGLLLIVFYTMV
jgi:hypothetical protein